MLSNEDIHELFDESIEHIEQDGRGLIWLARAIEQATAKRCAEIADDWEYGETVSRKIREEYGLTTGEVK